MVIVNIAVIVPLWGFPQAVKAVNDNQGGWNVSYDGKKFPCGDFMGAIEWCREKWEGDGDTELFLTCEAFPPRKEGHDGNI